MFFKQVGPTIFHYLLKGKIILKKNDMLFGHLSLMWKNIEAFLVYKVTFRQWISRKNRKNGNVGVSCLIFKHLKNGYELRQYYWKGHLKFFETHNKLQRTSCVIGMEAVQFNSYGSEVKF